MEYYGSQDIACCKPPIKLKLKNKPFKRWFNGKNLELKNLFFLWCHVRAL